MASTQRSEPGRTSPEAVSSASSIEGTVCRTVTFSRSISSCNRAGSRCPSAAAITNRPPHAAADQNSHTDRSKVAGVFSSTASSAVIRNSLIFHRNWFTTAACGTATPLGRPVEPEVKMT
ncbi:Uncharacterised protein [Mycobacteroides abscessus subsp. abscessus]|nr:Uncharacterised protein [Mycobacteroides abscessus subsp. abscessus]